MLLTLRQMTGCALYANDAVVGEVCDVYFDPSNWLVSHLTVETGSWSERHHVALPREALASVRCEANGLSIGLSLREILEAPTLEPSEPVSFREEAVVRRYFRGLPSDRRDFRAGDESVLSLATEAPSPNRGSKSAGARNERTPSRSALGCINYRISTVTGPLGHLDDMLIDPIDWSVRFIVIDTQAEPANEKVMITPEWICEIDNEEETVVVGQTQDTIRDCPPLDSSVLANSGICSSLSQKLISPQRTDWDEDVVAGAPRLDQLRFRRFDTQT